MKRKDKFTVEQLRSAVRRGTVEKVTLDPTEAGFCISIYERDGNQGALVATHTKEPRRYLDARRALNLLAEVGISEASIRERVIPTRNFLEIAEVI